MLETAIERIVVGNLYAEKPLGLYVVRGENVVLLGEIDDARDPPHLLQVPSARLTPDLSAMSRIFCTQVFEGSHCWLAIASTI